MTTCYHLHTTYYICQDYKRKSDVDPITGEERSAELSGSILVRTKQTTSKNLYEGWKPSGNCKDTACWEFLEEPWLTL
jgi:hypothetical protein